MKPTMPPQGLTNSYVDMGFFWEPDDWLEPLCHCQCPERTGRATLHEPGGLLGLSASVVALVARHVDFAGGDLDVVAGWAGQIFLSMSLG